jgi:hypothetical protein
MLPAATNMGAGMLMGMPDTLYDLTMFCSTGVQMPVPGPNTAMHTPGSPTSMKVIIGTGQPLLISTMISATISPGSGTLVGLVSQVSCMQGVFCMGSSKVMLDGQPGIYLGCMATQNLANCASGAQAVPSQVKVLISP